MDLQKLKELKNLIIEKSYREGEFTLASGQKSNYYIDLKATTLHPVGVKLIGDLVAECLLENQVSFDAVGGVTLGADPIATSVSLSFLNLEKIIPAYIIRKQPKGHGTDRYLEGTENFKKGSKLVVLEDVVSTGGTSLQGIDRAKAEGYDPICLVTIVDRQMGAKEKFESHGVKYLSLLKLSELQSSS